MRKPFFPRPMPPWHEDAPIYPEAEVEMFEAAAYYEAILTRQVHEP